MKFTLIDANDEPRTFLLKTLTLDAALKKVGKGGGISKAEVVGYCINQIKDVTSHPR